MLVTLTYLESLDGGSFLHVDCSGTNVADVGVTQVRRKNGKHGEDINNGITKIQSNLITKEELNIEQMTINFSTCRASFSDETGKSKRSNIKISKRQIHQLDLSSQNLSEIRDKLFLNFENLSILDLHSNSLSKLTNKSFEGLSSLKQMNLSFNNFVRLKQDWFQALKSLEKLDINNCWLKYFEPSEFMWPAKLFTLSLKNNLIPVMPPLPLATRNNREWAVHLEGNDIQCTCKRKEHTKETLNIDIFNKVHSICHGRQFGGTQQDQTPGQTGEYPKRLKSLWVKYINSSVCDGPFYNLGIKCGVDGTCKVECDGPDVEETNLKIVKYKGSQRSSPLNSTSKEGRKFNREESVNITCLKKIQYSMSIQAKDDSQNQKITKTNNGANNNSEKDISLYLALVVSIFYNVFLFYLIYKVCKRYRV